MAWMPTVPRVSTEDQGVSCPLSFEGSYSPLNPMECGQANAARPPSPRDPLPGIALVARQDRRYHGSGPAWCSPEDGGYLLTTPSYRKTVLVWAVLVHMLKYAPMGSCPASTRVRSRKALTSVAQVPSSRHWAPSSLRRQS